MVMVANLQYGWTLFVEPINHKFGWGRSAIQEIFSFFPAICTDCYGTKYATANKKPLIGGIFKCISIDKQLVELQPLVDPSVLRAACDTRTDRGRCSRIHAGLY